MPLGMDVGLNPGDFVLDGDPVFPPEQRERSPLPIFGPFLMCPNGWMHDDATQPRDFLFDGDPALPRQKGGGAPSPIFGPFLLWPNG